MGIESTKIKQICICAWDLDKAEAAWTKILGLEPEHLVTPDFKDVPTFTDARPDSFKAVPFLVYHLEDMALEIFAPGEGDTPWRRFLEKHGEGVMNLAFYVPDREKAYEAIGCRPYHEGFYPGGTYTFVDTMDGAGVELNIKKDEDNLGKIESYVADPASYANG
jgi:catechol 2,3-dioxygenase-like lactoylglutathione lyase family enzyme